MTRAVACRPCCEFGVFGGSAGYGDACAAIGQNASRVTKQQLKTDVELSTPAAMDDNFLVFYVAGTRWHVHDPSRTEQHSALVIRSWAWRCRS